MFISVFLLLVNANRDFANGKIAGGVYAVVLAIRCFAETQYGREWSKSNKKGRKCPAKARFSPFLSRN